MPCLESLLEPNVDDISAIAGSRRERYYRTFLNLATEKRFGELINDLATILVGPNGSFGELSRRKDHVWPHSRRWDRGCEYADGQVIEEHFCSVWVVSA